MGQSAAELRREIEGTRNELSGTLDAIGDRVSPGRIVERRKNKVRATMRSARETVFGHGSDSSLGSGTSSAYEPDEPDGLTARVGSTASALGTSVSGAPEAMRRGAEGSPLLAGALAFGAGLLVSVLLPSSRTETEVGERVMLKAEPLKDELREAGHEMAGHLKEQATEAVQEVKSTATEAAQQVREAAKESVEETKESGSG